MRMCLYIYKAALKHTWGLLQYQHHLLLLHVQTSLIAISLHHDFRKPVTQRLSFKQALDTLGKCVKIRQKTKAFQITPNWKIGGKMGSKFFTGPWIKHSHFSGKIVFVCAPSATQSVVQDTRERFWSFNETVLERSKGFLQVHVSCVPPTLLTMKPARRLS